MCPAVAAGGAEPFGVQLGQVEGVTEESGGIRAPDNKASRTWRLNGSAPPA